MPSPKYIMDLPPFSTYDLDMWIEAQKEAGGVGSSGRISKATLVQAIVQAITPTQHSELEGLLNDDHPQYFNLERGDARYAPLSHVERTDNPHNVTAAQTGADPAGTAAAAVAAHEAALDPHPQYQTSGEVDSQIDSKVAALKAESDPFPNYQKASEVNGQIDTKIAALKAEADPFPIYETAVEAQAKIDAKMAGHLSASDPHPQYASNEELNAAVLAEVQPVVQQSVDDYLAGSGGAAIDDAIDAKLPDAIATQVPPIADASAAAAVAAHEAELNPHPQYTNAVDSVNGQTGDVVLDIASLLSVQTIASAANITPLASNDKVEITALAVNATIDNPTGITSNRQGFVISIYSATAQTLTFGDKYRGIGTTLPTSTTAGKWMYIPVIRNETDDKWDVFTVSQQT